MNKPLASIRQVSTTDRYCCYFNAEALRTLPLLHPHSPLLLRWSGKVIILSTPGPYNINRQNRVYITRFIREHGLQELAGYRYPIEHLGTDLYINCQDPLPCQAAVCDEDKRAKLTISANGRLIKYLRYRARAEGFPSLSATVRHYLRMAFEDNLVHEEGIWGRLL